MQISARERGENLIYLLRLILFGRSVWTLLVWTFLVWTLSVWNLLERITFLSIPKYSKLCYRLYSKIIQTSNLGVPSSDSEPPPELWLQIGVFSIGKSPNLKSAINYDHLVLPSSIFIFQTWIFCFFLLQSMAAYSLPYSLAYNLLKDFAINFQTREREKDSKLPLLYPVLQTCPRVYWRKNRSRSVWNYDRPSDWAPSLSAADYQTL